MTEQADPTRDVLKEFGVLPGQPPVEQAGGGDPRLELDLTPISPYTALDADYAESILEGRAQDALREEQAQERAQVAQALAEGPTPQSTLFPAPSKPSVIGAGMEAGGRAAGEGVRAIIDGLRALVRVGPSMTTAGVLNLPQKATGTPIPDPMQATRQILMEGLIGLAFSPLVAAFGAAGQSFENISPETARKVLFEGGAAYTFNHLIAGAPAPGTITPEQAVAWKEPVTVRAFVEAAGLAAAPFAKGAVKKVGLAYEIQRPNLRSQRGSLSGSGAPFIGESRLNVARMNVEADVKQVAVSVNALMAARLAESRRTQKHAETIEAGKALQLTVEEALALDPLSVPLGEAKAYQDALRNLHAAAMEHLNNLKNRVKAGEQGLDAEAWATFDLGGELSIKQEMPGTEGGRIVEARKIGAEAERIFDPDEFTRLREQTAGADRGNFATMARRLDALPGGVKGVRARTFMRQVWEGFKLGKDMTYELWINWLLTNPETHVANTVGTGLTTAWEIPERAFAEGIHRLFSRNPDGVQAGETAAMLRSGVHALSDGFRLAGKAAQRSAELTPIERSLLSRTPLEERPRMISSAMVAERMGWDMDNPFGRALDVLGRAANLPTTGLAIEDAFFKGINYRMELSALALREAKAEGLTGAKLDRRVKQLEVDPPPPMMGAASQAAMVRTLNADLGPRGQAFMTFMNFPGGRVVAPFIRTPTNSFKWFGQRAPILAQLSAKNRADMMAGGAAREMAIARQALGAAFTAIIAYEVSQGNITGPGPTDKWLRKMQRNPATTTKPPNSIKAGGEYVNLARFDPVLGTFVGAVAAYIELAGAIPDQDSYDEWAAYAEALVIATGHMLVNKTYMQSAAAMLDAINDPDRHFGKIASSYGRTVVPAGLRKLTRVMDDNVIREVRGVTDAIKSGLPWYVDDVPVDRNPITGDAVEYPPGWGPDLFSPVLVFPQNDDPVFKELIDNGIRLTPVPRALGGTAQEGPLLQEERPGPPIPLDAAQRDYWKLAMTKHARVINGKLLHEALTDLVTSARYQEQSTGPDGGRALMYKATYHAYFLKGKAMLLDESLTLKEAVKTQATERGRAKLPVTNPRSPQYGARPGMAEDLIRSLRR